VADSPLVPSADELALLTAAHKLDAHALGQIHDRYYPELYRYALYRVGDPATAEDITSEIFVRFLEALHRQKAPQNTLRGWLFGVAAHLVADHFRRKPVADLDDAFPASDSPAAEAEERIRQQSVRAVLKHLTDEQQQVLALRFGNGFSVEETATAMSKSVTAVKALQFRALGTLRQKLGEVENE
jgi:RNA polymerase sigma-70 factor (ECF subfamily)